MDDINNLQNKFEQILFDLKDIIQILERDIEDPKKAITFSQVKEIESSIERFKKNGLPIPEELNELKISLFSRYEQNKHRFELYSYIIDSIQDIVKFKTLNIKQNDITSKYVSNKISSRKPANYERPLGSKGNKNLQNYLIPVIKLMLDGKSHNEAFKIVSEELDVRYNTVSAQCTRSLNLTTDEFRSLVYSRDIFQLLVKKFPDQIQIIEDNFKALLSRHN